MRKIIDECYEKAATLLNDNRDKLELMKDALMEYETIDAGQIDDIMAGNKPRPPADWSDGDDSGHSPSEKASEERSPKSSSSSAGPIGGPAGEH